MRRRPTRRHLLHQWSASSPATLRFRPSEGPRRDSPSEGERVGRFVHHTHPAFAELLGDLVMADGSTDHVGPILPCYGLVLVTTDVMNYDISSPRALRWLGFWVRREARRASADGKVGGTGFERSRCAADASRGRIWQVNRDVRVDATPRLDLRPSTPNPRRKQSESYKPLLRAIALPNRAG